MPKAALIERDRSNIYGVDSLNARTLHSPDSIAPMKKSLFADWHLASTAQHVQPPNVWLVLVICLLTARGVALGYMVGPALTLDKLATEADIIFKGQALVSEPAQDEWFKPISGFATRETRFKVISQIKGEAAEGEVRFRHYDKDGLGFGVYEPQHFHFEPGQTYIVFAQKTAVGARQTRLSHTQKMDLGVLRCLDQRPVTGKALAEIYWAEILLLRDSPTPDDVVYALGQLDGMSERLDGAGTSDFSRLEVLTAIHGLMARPEPAIAQAAIRLLAADSPYLDDWAGSRWLNVVGVQNPGIAPLELGVRNAGGALCWRELAAVAKGPASPETRALAIRALGLVKTQELRQMLDRWLKAPEAVVRAAAVLLFTDFASPDPYTTGQFAEFAADPAPEVRRCVAHAIGFMQDSAIVPVLAKLTKDVDANVRRAALESLHAFRPEIPAVAAALKADLSNPESQPLSLLALAREDPGAHLEALAKVVEAKTNPTNWSGGEIPAFTAWKLLFKHLRSQPPADVRSGKWDRYLDALEKVGNYSSSEPRDIYAFYLQRGMPERAAKYRAAAKKSVTYDLDYYFEMVDKDPAAYQGN